MGSSRKKMPHVKRRRERKREKTEKKGMKKAEKF